VDWNGCTPLSVAVLFNYLEVAVYLLHLGAHVHHIDNHGFWLLYVATFANRIDMIWILINTGASVHLLFHRSETVLGIACQHNCWDAAELFIIAVANHDNIGSLSIRQAALLGHQGFLEALVDKDPSIAQCTYDTDGITLLHLTSICKCSNCMSLLLVKGADMLACFDTNQRHDPSIWLLNWVGWMAFI